MDGSNPVTAYLPGQTYTVMLTMNSAPTKKGFQSTALTGANDMAGDFTGGSNTQINSANARKYANHTGASNVLPPHLGTGHGQLPLQIVEM